jgi:hypothetical protein
MSHKSIISANDKPLRPQEVEKDDLSYNQPTLILHAVNIRVGGGLQVADSIISQAIKTNDFDRIFISPELDDFSTGGYGSKVEVINGRLRVFKLFAKIRSHKQKRTVFAIFGPTGVPKFLQGNNITYVVGFATPWLIPSNHWYMAKMSWKKRIIIFAKQVAYRIEASALICEAEYIKAEMNNWKVPFLVVKNGSHQVFNMKNTIPSVPIKPSTKKLVGLYVTAGYPHKNNEYLYEFAKKAQVQLGIPVIFRVTLTEKEYKSIYPHNDSKSFIENIGRVPLSKLPQMYAESDFVLVPSLIEASSAVIYESIASEKITFAFDMIFNREIGKDAVTYLNGNNLDEAIRLFCQVFQNEDIFYDKMRKLGILKSQYSCNSELRYQRILGFLKNA